MPRLHSFIGCNFILLPFLTRSFILFSIVLIDIRFSNLFHSPFSISFLNRLIIFVLNIHLSCIKLNTVYYDGQIHFSVNYAPSITRCYSFTNFLLLYFYFFHVIYNLYIFCFYLCILQISLLCYYLSLNSSFYLIIIVFHLYL